MVVKIQPPAANITATLLYNERKMTDREGILDGGAEREYLLTGGEGHIVTTRNVGPLTTLEQEFTRLERLNRRTTRGRKLENPAFHMSINPGEGDRPMGEEEVAAFAAEVMDKLGYGASPWRLYRHDDTGRTHYHVVSTRIGQDGRKVADAFENRRCERICRGLAAKYGYTYGLGEEDMKEAPNIDERDERAVKETQDSNTLAETLRTAHRDTMTWSFTTMEEYMMIMRLRHRVEAEVFRGPAGDEMLRFTPLPGKDGGRSSMTQGMLGVDACGQLKARLEAERRKKRVKTRQKERLEKELAAAAEKANDWKEYQQLLRARGIAVVLSWSDKAAPNDGPFGVTYLDRATRCAFKGSETAVPLKTLLETAQKKGWKISVPRDVRKRREAGRTAMQKMLDKYRPGAGGGLHSGTGGGKTPAKKSQGSNADASKNRSEIRYGDEKPENDIVI